MKYSLSLFEWGEKRDLNSDLTLKNGDRVVVDLGFGKHLATIKEIAREDKTKSSPCPEAPALEYEGIILRKATSLEKEKAHLESKRRSEMLQKCRGLIKKYDLPMKLVGVDISVEGGGIVFGFTAEERIDFRTLVRELASIFQKSVRLQQLGSRDEARMCGGIGPCGRPLCCLSPSIPMKSISTEMARVQQISHRGNERLSGCCNRLMCCLAFEQETYDNLRMGLPEIGSRVRTASGSGTVENLKILSQEVGVKLDDKPGGIIWVKAEEIKD